jgi:hypothetical protein
VDTVSAQQVPARAQRLFSIWSRLSADPMSEDEFLAAITRALDRGPGAEADVSAFRHSLVGCGSVTARRGEDGSLSYEKAETFPTWPENNGPGSASYDQQTAELAAEQERQFDRAAAEVERNAPQNRQREELDAHIRKVVDERIDARLAELRRASDGAALTRARELLRQSRQSAEAEAPATTTRPGVARPEGKHHEKPPSGDSHSDPGRRRRA